MKNTLKSLVYGAIDLATARRGISRIIGGERVRFPPRWCRFYPTDYEAATFAFLRAHCKPGHTVLDIGSHLGLFTVVMARLVGPRGRVFSFEPTPITRRILQRTVRLNNLDAMVEVRGEAVTRTTGGALFYDTGNPGSNANSLVRTQRSHHHTIVSTVSLDDFARAHDLKIACMKIDVEGAELDLLRGATETFAACRPSTFLSLHPSGIQRSGGSLAEVWEFLKRNRLSVIQHGSPVCKLEFCKAQDLFDVELLPA